MDLRRGLRPTIIYLIGWAVVYGALLAPVSSWVLGRFITAGGRLAISNYDISPGCELFNAGFPVLFFLAEDKYYNIDQNLIRFPEQQLVKISHRVTPTLVPFDSRLREDSRYAFSWQSRSSISFAIRRSDVLWRRAAPLTRPGAATRRIRPLE